MRTLILASLKLVIAFALCYAMLFLLLVKVIVGGSGLIYRTSPLLHWKGGSTWSRFQDHDAAHWNDVLVIGSSHAYRGYDPRLFAARGYRMFNLGSTAQTPLNTWPIVAAHVNAANTGLLLVDVYMGIFNNSGLESATDLIPNVDDDLLAADIAWRVRDPRVINLLALRMAKRNHPPTYSTSEYRGGGYCSRPDSVSVELVHAREAATSFDGRQLRYLGHIVAHCRKVGIPVVLVTHPMPLATDTAGHARFARVLRAYLGAEGPPYLDLATGHDLHDRHHFYDHNHLNQAGVDRFNPVLIDTLEALGLLRAGAH